jgi:hypothetical protein
VRGANSLSLEEARARGLVAPLATAARAAVPDWLVKLLSCSPFRGRLSEEETLAVQVADDLRRLSLSGQLHAVWDHAPNQSDLPRTFKLAAIIQAKKAAMGAIPGTPDLQFLWGTGSGCIELKVKRRQTALRVHDGELKEKPLSQLQGQLSQPQRWHRQWCEMHKVPYEVASSIADVRLILKRWGVLD